MDKIYELLANIDKDDLWTIEQIIKFIQNITKK